MNWGEEEENGTNGNGDINKNKNNFVGPDHLRTGCNRSSVYRFPFQPNSANSHFSYFYFISFFALKRHYVFAGTANIFTVVGFVIQSFFSLSLLHYFSLPLPRLLSFISQHVCIFFLFSLSVSWNTNTHTPIASVGCYLYVSACMLY